MDLLTADRWAKIDALFDAALEREADERTAFLRAACGDDPALYRTVAALLDSEAAAEAALGESATDFAAHLLDAATQAEPDLVPGALVGSYRIVREIGRGGMGTVYLAERADGTFEKQVALKLVKRGMDTDEVLRRFRYERQILAGLDHPGIARMLDAGAATDGRPYLVMEVVEGEPITAYAEARHLGLDARLALFERVCEAVRYAHRRLVVHRDLKPSNILVTGSETGSPQVKLLDFGIARLLADDGEGTPLTRPEQQMLTPEYAAPEQRRGEPATTATDVYALGVLLFELLVGRRPKDESEHPSAAADEASRHDLDGDLDTLVLTALHADPARRYPSAEALLDDLRRLDEGFPLRARPDTLGYRARKFVGRHRGSVAIAMLGVLVLIAFATLLAVEQRQTARERDKAQATADFLESLFAAADPFAEARQDTLRVRDLLDHGLGRVRTELADEPAVQAQLLHVIGQVYARLGLHAQAEPTLGEAVALRRSVGSIPADLAASLIALAAAVRERGDPARADTLAVEASALAARTGDPDLIAACEIERALVLQDFGRHQEAESLNVAAFDRLRATHGEDHGDVAVAESRIARALMNQGRFDDAERRYRSSLARFGRAFGEDHPARLTPLRDLSFLLLATGRLDEAEAHAAEAVAFSRAARPGGSSAAQMLSVYGMVLRRQGKLDEAEAILRESAALPPRRLEDRAVPLGVLASVLQQRGDLDEAEAAQREALDLLRTAHGPDSPQAIASAVKLAAILQAEGRFAEAERLLLDAHATPTNGGSHHGGGALKGLAALYEAWGRQNEAARYRTLVEPPSTTTRR